LPLHNAFMVVFLIALTEATLSYSSYQHVNLTGEPFCCPLPSYVVGTFIVQIFRLTLRYHNLTNHSLLSMERFLRQTLSRSLFLVVSLGYGIVRPKLMKAEWIAVSVVSVLYFITGNKCYIECTFHYFDFYCCQKRWWPRYMTLKAIIMKRAIRKSSRASNYTTFQVTALPLICRIFLCLEE